MITFVCFKWRPAPGYRSSYGPEQVNTLARMVARHYRRPHRFVCVTDDWDGIDTDLCEIYELWEEWGRIPNPSSRSNPSCYRRLRLFARSTGAWLGERIVSLDLDAVICGDLEPLFDGLGDFKAWGDTNRSNRYNGSMFALRAGSLPHVFENFDPVTGPAAAKRAGHYGSDQAWLCHALGPHWPIWTQADGVYSFRNDIQRSQARSLPKGARVVFFHGKVDPWSPEARKLAWVREHYR